MELPKNKTPADRVDPKIFVFYSPPKAGKTTLLAQIPNCLIIDLEDGAKYLEALKVKINSLQELHELGEEIKKQGKPYKYIAIDTVTQLENWAEGAATTKYKNSLIGKNFTGSTVLELPNGAGYLPLREAYKQWIDYIYTLADNIILVAHIKDKFITKNGSEVSALDLDLTGKIKNITCARADAIALMTRDKEGKVKFNFKSTDEINCGSRCEHLRGKEIIISEIINGKVITYWNEIYKDL